MDIFAEAYFNNQSLNKLDVVFLEPAATIDQVENICNRALSQECRQVTVPPLFVKKAKEILSRSAVNVSTVIGYPYGWSAIEAKVAETILAMIDGADELEIVINIIALKNNDWQYLAREINNLVTIVRRQQKKICFVVETSFLAEDEITKCCDLYGVAGVDSINISTGFHRELPSAETVRFWRSQLADSVALKLYADMDEDLAEKYSEAGATFTGTIVK